MLENNVYSQFLVTGFCMCLLIAVCQFCDWNLYSFTAYLLELLLFICLFDHSELVYWESVGYKISQFCHVQLSISPFLNLSYTGVRLLVWQLLFEDTILLLLIYHCCREVCYHANYYSLEVICLFSLSTFMISSLVFCSFTLIWVWISFLKLVLDSLYFLNPLS